MNFLFHILLFVLWTLLWSFASVVIYRIKSWEKGIFMGRSHCSNCNKKLTTIDLIPLVWYILAQWKCNKCNKKVPIIYPILEVSMWLLFAAIWYFLIDFWLIIEWNSIEIVKLLFWLFIWFVTIVYTFYDILFLEIPEIVLAIWVTGVLSVLVLQTIFPWLYIVEMLPVGWDLNTTGIFAILWSIITVIILYIIMLKELSVLKDIILLTISIGWLFVLKYIGGWELSGLAITNGLIWMLGIFLFFFWQIVISKWAWMGWGDLRIAIFIWLLLGISLSFPAMMLTYMIGSIIWIGFILYSRLWKWETNMATQIPFWPFLAAGFFTCIFFEETILRFMSFYL